MKDSLTKNISQFRELGIFELLMHNNTLKLAGEVL